MKRLFATSHAAAPLSLQILVLLLLSLVGAQLINAVIIVAMPPPPPEVYRMSEVARIIRGAQAGRETGLVSTVSRAPPAAHTRTPGQRRGPVLNPFASRELAQTLHVDEARVRVVDDRPARLFEPVFRFEPERREPAARRDDWRQRRMPLRPENALLFGQFKASVLRDDGTWVTVVPRPRGYPSVWQQRVLVWLLVCAVVLAPLAYWFARRLTAPITLFARAAERLGRNPQASPLPLGGPAEVRVAVTAFNEMQSRLRRYVDERTAMIGAVAHDLRTPLTRLRFLLETRPDDLREKMEREIDEMEAMVTATLAFVKDASAQGERVKLDLGAMVESLAADLAETGADIRCGPCPRIIVSGDPIALRRLLDNLLSNAVKFAGAAEVTLATQGDDAVLEVLDRGPGLAEADLEQAFEPFHRVESSRNRETGGIGLGLAVVRSVARAHGGEAVLSNRPEGGLVCRVRLPLDTRERQPNGPLLVPAPRLSAPRRPFGGLPQRLPQQ